MSLNRIKCEQCGASPAGMLRLATGFVCPDCLLEERENLRDALMAWKKFCDAMPNGRLGKIACDIGLLNEAFYQMEQALRLKKGKRP